MLEGLDIDEVIREFDLISKNAAKVQEETLKKILQDNGSAEYLLNHGLDGKTDPESFKKSVPIVTHKDLEPYIQRIADGDSSPILTKKPITTISLSSGTTQGKPKYVPFNEELMDTTLQIYRTSYAFRNRQFPLSNGKALQFLYGSKTSLTKGGLSAGTATTNVFQNCQFKTAMKSMQSLSCSPDEVIFGGDFHQSLYCHLLCGLIFHEDIQVVSSTFAHSIVLALRTFEHLWRDLISDIRAGELSNRVSSPAMRSAMAKLLKPNPSLAASLSAKCVGLSNWNGLIPELFPNVKYVYAIMTGSMEPYTKKLRHYAAGIPLCCADYGSSEGWIGANVNPTFPPEEATFAVLPNISYFEFIPLNEPGQSKEPVGLSGVKTGEEYEIIITNMAGLYRYRLGDVVKVMGFYNSTPELKFIRRMNLLLSINIDKNTETDLQMSVDAAAVTLAAEKLEIVDYSSYVETSNDPGHYVIFWETTGQPSDDVAQQCCNLLDSSFIDAGYASSRKVNAIGPLELRLVSKGTFQNILDHFVRQGAAVSQFKTPRCVSPTNHLVRQILCNNVTHRYFSTAF